MTKNRLKIRGPIRVIRGLISSNKTNCADRILSEVYSSTLFLSGSLQNHQYRVCKIPAWGVLYPQRSAIHQNLHDHYRVKRHPHQIIAVRCYPFPIRIKIRYIYQRYVPNICFFGPLSEVVIPYHDNHYV